MTSREFKVGIVVFIALAILGGMLFISGAKLLKVHDRLIKASFSDVVGLQRGAPVLMLGVEVGQVSEIKLQKDKVIVSMVLQPDVKIPVDSYATIGIGSLLGERYVEINPGRSDIYLKDGDILIGVTPKKMEDIMDELKQGFGEIKRTFDYINQILGDKERREKIAQALQELEEAVSSAKIAFDNMAIAMEEISKTSQGITEGFSDVKDYLRKTSNKIQKVSSTLNEILLENKKQISRISKNVADLTEELSDVLNDFNYDGLSGKELRDMVTQIKEAAFNFKKLSKHLDELVQDMGSEGRSVKQTIKDIEEITQKTKAIVNKIEQIKINGSLRIRAGKTNEQESYNIYQDIKVDVKYTKWYGDLGIYRLGGDEYTQLMVGKKVYSGQLGLKLGLVDDYFGLGLDFFPKKSPFYLDLTWINPDNPFWNAEVGFKFKKWSLFYRVEGLGREEFKSFGIEWRF